MKFNSYTEYVEASKEFYKDRNLTIPAELMIVPEGVFNTFNGVIDFGAGSVKLTNKKECNGCNCETKCENHKD